MGGRGSGSGIGSAGKNYTSSDKTIYSSSSEILRVEREVSRFGGGPDVLEASSMGNREIKLDYATPSEYYQQNSKTSYAIYDLKSGITDAGDISGSRYTGSKRDTNDLQSKFNPENKHGRTRSVGIDWNNVNTVHGNTYKIKDFLKEKGFKWNSAKKAWSK